MRNIDEAGRSDNPTVHTEIQQRCLDELATEEVLDLSRPPADFPIPEAPAVAKVIEWSYNVKFHISVRIYCHEVQ